MESSDRQCVKYKGATSHRPRVSTSVNFSDTKPNVKAGVGDLKGLGQDRFHNSFGSQSPKERKLAMTHLAETNVVNEVVQVLAERGFDGLADCRQLRGPIGRRRKGAAQ